MSFLKSFNFLPSYDYLTNGIVAAPLIHPVPKYASVCNHAFPIRNDELPLLITPKSSKIRVRSNSSLKEYSESARIGNISILDIYSKS